MKQWDIIWFVRFVVAVICLSPHTSTAAPCTEGLPALFQRVSPAVVSLSSIVIDPLKSTERLDVTTGAGFIISADGLVLTGHFLETRVLGPRDLVMPEARVRLAALLSRAGLAA